MYPEITQPPQTVDVTDVNDLYALDCGSNVDLRAIVVTKDDGDPSWSVSFYSRNWDTAPLDIVLIEEASDGKQQITTSTKHGFVAGDPVSIGSLSPGGGDWNVLRVIDDYTFVIDQDFIYVVGQGGTIQLSLSDARRAHFLVKTISATANVARHDGELPYRNQEAMDNTGQPRKIYALFDTEGEYVVSIRMLSPDCY